MLEGSQGQGPAGHILYACTRQTEAPRPNEHRQQTQSVARQSSVEIKYMSCALVISVRGAIDAQSKEASTTAPGHIAILCNAVPVLVVLCMSEALVRAAQKACLCPCLWPINQSHSFELLLMAADIACIYHIASGMPSP